MSYERTRAAKKSGSARAALFVATGLWLLLAIPVAKAEQVAYMDYNRQWHVVDASELTDDDLEQGPVRTLRAAAPGDITFNVAYLDVTGNTGVGFDHPSAGALRRATFEAVLAYLDSVLYESGTCDIRVEQSETSGTGFLATGGPRYHFSASSGDYFLPGDAFEHITTGIDPGGGPDVVITVNFGYTWNGGTDPVQPGEMDLYSVLLHELTHGLGVLSLSDADGGSQLSSGRLATFDNFLYTSGGVKLWNTQGVFQVSASVLRGGTGSVLFRGPQASKFFLKAPAVYTPSTFNDGSSVSHWDSNITPRPVMRHSIANGTENRAYQPFEVAALRDLGYDTDSGQDPPPGPEEPEASTLAAATDAGEGRMRLEWTSTGLTPTQFLGFAYDLYLEDWASRAPAGGLWYAFSSAASSGDMRLEYAGAYHLWISSQYADGTWLSGGNPATTILQSGTPHRPLNAKATDRGDKKAQVSWKSDLYGTWSYWILAYNIDTGQWVETLGPQGESLWQYVLQGGWDFLTGSTELTVPASGQYFFFIAGMAWDAKTMGEFASAYVHVP